MLTGSEYITWWLYKLAPVVDGALPDILSEGIGYLFQVFGIFVFSLLLKRNKRLSLSRPFFISILIADLVFTALAFLSPTAFGIIAFGFIMNFLHGVIGGYYLTRLSLNVPQQKRGTVFGVAYAFGSVGSWLISLPMNGEFLASPYIFIVYSLLVASVIAVELSSDNADFSDLDVAKPFAFDKAVIPLAAGAVLLLSAVKGLGFYFPAADHLGGAVSAIFARSFYAVGLILAGIINDKSRKTGAICCLAALVFPFISLALGDEPSLGLALWIASYIFFGFFSVYRVVTFSDLSGKKSSLLFIAGFGLMFGRVGDAASAICGIATRNSSSILLAVSSVLFIVTIFVFFMYYNKTYSAVLSKEANNEALLQRFEAQYQLSVRETEVFRLIISGRSTSEIASDLYIDESTVKFHVKNILKKTACANRTQLTVQFRKQ